MSTKVTTSKVRFSYVHAFEAYAHEQGQTPKYSVSIIIPKSDKATLDKIRAAVDLAAKEGAATKFGGAVPKNYKHPLRDGDEDKSDDPAYANAYFLNASSNRRPGIVDANLNAILDAEEFYSGCFGRASLNFFAFSMSGNKGVACGLNNLQKTAEGERLGGAIASAESDFGDDDMLG
jgi:hypothetical protein